MPLGAPVEAAMPSRRARSRCLRDALCCLYVFSDPKLLLLNRDRNTVTIITTMISIEMIDWSLTMMMTTMITMMIVERQRTCTPSRRSCACRGGALPQRVVLRKESINRARD